MAKEKSFTRKIAETITDTFYLSGLESERPDWCAAQPSREKRKQREKKWEGKKEESDVLRAGE